MEIVPNLQRDKMSKEQIEYLQKQEQQYKYIGSLKNIPGLTLFSFNRVTKVVKVADITKQMSVNIKGKSRHRYGNLVMSLNRKGGKGGNVRVVDGGYYVCARCGKKLTNWERF